MSSIAIVRMFARRGRITPSPLTHFRDPSWLGLRRVASRWSFGCYAVVGMRMGSLAMIQVYRRIQV